MKKLPMVLVWCTVIIAGCGIFQTRQPQPPQQSPSDYQPPLSPDVVIQNLINSISDRNVNNYIACLSDPSFGGRPFSFEPPPDVYRQYQGIFENWDVSSEQYYFNNLVVQSAKSSSSQLVLTSENLTTLGDSASFSASYTLYWPNDVQGSLQQVEGNLIFYLGTDRNENWSIYKWIDSKVGDSLSWSDLKARFSQ